VSFFTAVKITDGTNIAAVKAASTPPVVADPALVVAISPNTSTLTIIGNLTNNNAAPSTNNFGVLAARANAANPTWVEGNQVLLSTDLSGNLRVAGTFSAGAPADTVGATVALNALNVAATIVLAGQGGVGMFLAAGTLIGTIVPELSYDGGTTWVASMFYDPAANATAGSVVFGSNNTATSLTILAAGGVSNVRVRVSAFTSGTANCNLRATLDASGNVQVIVGAVAADTAAFGNPVLVGGVDGSGNVQELPVTDAGATAPVMSLLVGGIDVSGKAQQFATFPTGNTFGQNLGVTFGIAFGQADAITPAAYVRTFDQNGVTGLLGIESFLFNGTTFDRTRSVGIGNNVVATGITASGVYGQFNLTLPVITSGNYSSLQIDSNARLIVSPILPTNAAQETGNLATLVTQTRNNAQIVDALNSIISLLTLLNRNVASTMPGADSEPDNFFART
jgi:hypothetical protein